MDDNGIKGMMNFGDLQSIRIEEVCLDLFQQYMHSLN